MDAVVIGAGQAGLSVGYYLSQLGRRFVILDANERVGDSWRNRWDSLKLFTPARYDSLPGLPFPAPPDSFPTKDEMADYLESYARHFDLPVEMGVRVQRVSKLGERYLVEAQGREIVADNVIVAMASYQKPKIPELAGELDPSITQLHSIDYRSPDQLQPGKVLLVGAGNTGSELAMELCRDREVVMSGRDTGHIPFRIEGFWGRLFLVRLVLRVVFHRVLTIRTWIGRKARPKMTKGGGPLIRVKPKDLARAGVVRTGRTVGVVDGKPQLEDGTVLDVPNVIWCSGFHPGFSWIDLPVFDDETGKPNHVGGCVDSEPGLFFVGLHFLFAASSGMIQGVGRDAQRIVDTIAAREPAVSRRPQPAARAA